MSCNRQLVKSRRGLAPACAIALVVWIAVPGRAQEKQGDQAPGFDVAKKDATKKDSPEDNHRGVTASNFYKLLDNSVGNRFGSMILVFGGCYSGDFAEKAAQSKIATRPVAILTATGPKGNRYQETPSLDGQNPFLTGVSQTLSGLDLSTGKPSYGTAAEALDAGKGTMTNAVNAYNTNNQAAIEEKRKDEQGNVIEKAVASAPGLTAFPRPDTPGATPAGASLTLTGPAGAAGKKYAIVFMGKPETYYDWVALQAQYQSLIEAGYQVEAFFGTGAQVTDRNDRDNQQPILTDPNTGGPGISVGKQARDVAKARNGQEPAVTYTYTVGSDTHLLQFKAATFTNLKAALTEWKKHAAADTEGKNQYFILFGTHSTERAISRDENDLEISQLVLPGAEGGPAYVGGPSAESTPTFELRGFGGASLLSGHAAGDAGFDGAVLFPVGHRVLVGPTGGFEWTRAATVERLGSMTTGSTFANKTLGFKSENLGVRVMLPLGRMALSAEGGATIAETTVTQTTGFCTSAGCSSDSTVTRDTVVGPFVSASASLPVSRRVSVFVEGDYRHLRNGTSFTVNDVGVNGGVSVLWARR